jgi:hypothetical protein
MALRDKIIEVMWKRNVFAEKRADDILKLVGIEYKDLNKEQGK